MNSLIAIMLGRLKMSVQNCIDEYNRVMGKVFVPRSDVMKKVDAVTGGQSYDSDVLEEVIRDLVGRKLGDKDALLLDESSENKCKV